MVGRNDDALDENDGGKGSGPAKAAQPGGNRQGEDAGDEEEPGQGVREFDKDQNALVLPVVSFAVLIIRDSWENGARKSDSLGDPAP